MEQAVIQDAGRTMGGSGYRIPKAEKDATQHRCNTARLTLTLPSSALSRRPVSGLGQGEEPEASRDEPGGGFIRVNLRPPLQTSPAK
jgi:hypothetical protein